jgi:hypothetical protein
MGEDLKPDTGLSCLLCDRPDLIKREFTGKNNPGETLLRSPENTVSVMDGHLGGGMEGKVRDDLPCQRSDPGILHKNSVDTDRIKPDEVVCNSFQFAVVDERIDRDIDPDPPGMGLPDPRNNFFVRKICSIFPCAKPFPAQVHCIGPCRNGSPERFRRTCRCKQFGEYGRR